MIVLQYFCVCVYGVGWGMCITSGQVCGG